MPQLFTFTPTEAATKDSPQYWDAYVFESDFLDNLGAADRQAVMHTLEQFRSNHYKSATLKKFVGVPVYTLRVNDKDRLVFSTQALGTHRCAIIHGLMHHNYETYLYTSDPHAAPTYNKTHEAEMLAQRPIWLTASTATEFTPHALPTETFYKRKIITLTEDQQQLVFNPESPLKSGVLSGAAGTGKTLVMITAIKSMLGANPIQNIRCITPSRLLTKNLASTWCRENPHASEGVTFMTYDEFIKPNLRDLTLADDNTFDAWYEDIYIGRQKHSPSKPKSSPPIFSLEKDDSELVKQTFKLFSGRAIESIAERDLVFRDAGAKEVLFAAYMQWMGYLETNKLLHPAFYRLPDISIHKDMNPLVVWVDESQDFTFQQITNIYEHSKQTVEQPVVLFNFDSHQISDMYSCERERILQMLAHDTGHETPHTRLIGNHRSDPSITAWTDQLVDMKYKVTRGKADAHEDASLKAFSITTTPEEPSLKGVIWINPSLQGKNQIQNLFNFNAISHVIITHECWIKEAENLFCIQGINGESDIEPTVLSFKQAKGLEYDRALLYKPFEHAAFYEANATLPSVGARARPQNQAKKGEGDRRHLAVFNDLISGSLRAESFITIYQDKNANQLHNVIQHFSSQMKTTPTSTPVLEQTQPNLKLPAYTAPSRPNTVIDSTPAEWVQRIEDMLLIDPSNKLAEKKYIKHGCLTLTGKNFAKFKQSIINPRPPSPPNTAQALDMSALISSIDATDDAADGVLLKLNNLLSNPADHTKFLETNGIELLLSILDTHDEVMIEYTTAILAELALYENNHKRMIEAKGMIEALILTLNTHNEQTKRSIITVFIYLAQYPANHPRIIEEKLIDVLIPLLDTARDEQTIQFITAVLTYLAKNKMNHERIREANGIEALIHLLSSRDFPTKIQAHAAFSYLALNQTNHALIFKTNGIEALVPSLSLDLKAKAITEYAAAAFLRLAFYNEAHTFIRDAGVIEALILLLDVDNNKIMGLTTSILTVLASFEPNCERILGTKGIINKLVSLLSLQDESRQTLFVSLLQSLVKNKISHVFFLECIKNIVESADYNDACLLKILFLLKNNTCPVNIDGILYLAIKNNRSLLCINKLIEAGANINGLCNHHSPLLLSILLGKIDIARALLTHGAQLHIDSALLCTAIKKSGASEIPLDIILQLIEKGAPDEEGRALLHANGLPPSSRKQMIVAAFGSRALTISPGVFGLFPPVTEAEDNPNLEPITFSKNS